MINFLKKSKRIEFSVEGKPPKKTSKESVWSENSNQAQLIFDLRKKAFETCNKEKLKDYFHGPVKLTLTVYASNILDRKDTNDYVGDLDALISGVFECLQPAPQTNRELDINSMLKDRKDFGHEIPLVVADDAQIVTTVAKKRENKKPFYTVIIEEESSN